MGAWNDGFCYQSQEAAVDAYYGSTPPSVQPGSAVYYSITVKKPQGWALDTYRVYSGGTSVLQTSSLLPVPVFDSCDPSESFNDGMAVGWGVASAMIAVGALMMIKRATR